MTASRSRNLPRVRRWLLLSLLTLWLLPSSVCARELSYRHPEPAVYAALLYRFAQFTRWPENSFSAPDSPLVFAILDPAVAESALASLSNKKIGSHPLQVVLLLPGAPLPHCHLLFVAGAHPRLLASAASRPILTIGTTAGFAAAGGIIELLRQGDKTRFGINLGAARRAELSISAEMLDLANFVLRIPGPGGTR